MNKQPFLSSPAGSGPVAQAQRHGGKATEMLHTRHEGGPPRRRNLKLKRRSGAIPQKMAPLSGKSAVPEDTVTSNTKTLLVCLSAGPQPRPRDQPQPAQLRGGPGGRTGPPTPITPAKNVH